MPVGIPVRGSIRESRCPEVDSSDPTDLSVCSRLTHVRCVLCRAERAYASAERGNPRDWRKGATESEDWTMWSRGSVERPLVWHFGNKVSGLIPAGHSESFFRFRAAISGANEGGLLRECELPTLSAVRGSWSLVCRPAEPDNVRRHRGDRRLQSAAIFPPAGRGQERL